MNAKQVDLIRISGFVAHKISVRVRAMSAFIFMGMATLFFPPSLAHADLKDLIAQHSGELSIITTVEDGNDLQYGILTQSKESLAKSLELFDENKLENAYFRVVENQSDTTLPITDFDGRNVLYHLMQARAYYLPLATRAGNSLETFNHKVVVRVRVDHSFNVSSHFSDFEHYNDSGYVPGRLGSWGNEILFDSRKSQMAKLDYYDIAMGAGAGAISQDWLAAGNILPDLVNKYDSGIDSPKIPSVIHHEAFHWASDEKSLIPTAGSGNQVGEDYANYYAASMLGKPTVAEIGDFASRLRKRHYGKIHEVKEDAVEYNPQKYNAIGFVPSFFWKIRKEIGRERTDQLLWNSMKYLKGGTFHTRIPPALLKATDEDSELSADEKQFIHDLTLRYRDSFINSQRHFFGDMIPVDAAFPPAPLTEAAMREAASVRAMVEDMRSQGVEVTPEMEKQFEDTAREMEVEAHQPGFAKKIVFRLRDYAVRTGEYTSYAGTAANGGFAAPIRFGSEFLVATLTGHSMKDYLHERAATQLTGASGGLAGLYYLNVGLSLVGNPLPLNVSMTAVSMVEGLVCRNAKTSKKAELKKYCAENEKIAIAINSRTGKAGDVTGEKVHDLLVRLHLARPSPAPTVVPAAATMQNGEPLSTIPSQSDALIPYETP